MSEHVLQEEDWKNAALSDCGKYRYDLFRLLRPMSYPDIKQCCFVMLNPSTADATEDDPTIRRCMGYASKWGYTQLVVVNLFAWRATDPSELPVNVESRVGPNNDYFITSHAEHSEIVVCGWGASSYADDGNRAAHVLNLIKTAGKTPMCLKKTKSGSPAHPLYLPKDLEPAPLLGD